ncbi:DUF1850 domain-containing protein [Salsuginibacillus kocurii]|uniref:DUF1850 domain-containing protein n=1 Tax=Salsuginibacillus kocurii TaxID=427078 RepID=UPI00036914FD|nr:DUF1850 domain-containing protein [Salsuginibacillus kocurii]
MMRDIWSKGIIILSLAIGLSACEAGEKTLIIEHAKKGEVFHEGTVEVGDEVALSWIHSVEQTPWKDVFSVDGSCELLLTETHFESFGAGVEHEFEQVERENGTVIAQGINDCHDSVDWIHSHEAEYRVTVNEKTVADPEELPHHEPLRIMIEKR